MSGGSAMIPAVTPLICWASMVASSSAMPSTLETIATSYRPSSRPSASTRSSGPKADPPIPIWRMCRTGPNASASIASISARIRKCSPCAWATLSGAPCPRSAVCSAARPSLGLTISPANIASRFAASSVSAASCRNAASASGERCVLAKSKCSPVSVRLSLATRSGSAANRSFRLGCGRAARRVQASFMSSVYLGARDAPA